MGRTLERHVDARARDRSAQELLAARPDALKGVSAADAASLEEAFGISTIEQLASSTLLRHALAVLAVAGTPGHDPGPPPPWEARFGAAPHGAYLARPDLFRLEFGPVLYRGRLDGTARVLIVGQDPSTDEILAGRILVGLSGQRVQGLLRRLGIARSYVMLNTFLYSVQGQFTGDLRTVSRSDPVLAYRNELFDAVAAENPLEAVIAVGNGAADALSRWPGATGLSVVRITHPSAPDAAIVLSSWNEGLRTLRALVEPDEGRLVDPSDYGSDWLPSDHASIPRFDLPFGTPAWHGDGDHSHRDGPDRIVWQAP